MKIVFFGTPRFAQIVLEKLIDSPFKPQLVVTAPDTKVGRGRILQSSPVKKTALENNIKILQPRNLADPNFKFKISFSEGKLRNFKFDLAILAAYGQIIPPDILTIPKFGFINIHPSLLPKYRGPSPIQSAILAGEEKTGVSIMKLDREIDHGPLLASKKITIGEGDTWASLSEYLAKIGAGLLIQTLPQYLNGTLAPKPQNHSEATFTKHITKKDGYFDIASPPDRETFDRMIRAYYPWPGTWTKLKIKNEKLKIIKFLPGNLVQLEGKRPMTIKELKNGYPDVYEQIRKLVGNQAKS